MRTTTIPSMLGIISRNYNRGVKTAKLFELAFVYLPYELPLKDLPNEKPVLTIGMYGDVDFYDIKGVVEELLIKLRISNYEFVQEKDDPVFHPGRTANLLINGKTAGILGEIHPDIVEEFETPSRTYIGMIDETCLLKNAKLTVEYKPLPKYPAVERDIAIIVGEKITAAEIEKTIKKAGGKTLEEINLFDMYKGKQIQEGMKSMAYSLTFRAEDRTLTDKEVNDIIAKILNSLKIAFDAKLRE